MSLPPPGILPVPLSPWSFSVRSRLYYLTILHPCFNEMIFLKVEVFQNGDISWRKWDIFWQYDFLISFEN